MSMEMFKFGLGTHTLYHGKAHSNTLFSSVLCGAGNTLWLMYKVLILELCCSGGLSDLA